MLCVWELYLQYRCDSNNNNVVRKDDGNKEISKVLKKSKENKDSVKLVLMLLSNKS